MVFQTTGFPTDMDKTLQKSSRILQQNFAYLRLLDGRDHALPPLLRPSCSSNLSWRRANIVEEQLKLHTDTIA